MILDESKRTLHHLRRPAFRTSPGGRSTDLSPAIPLRPIRAAKGKTVHCSRFRGFIAHPASMTLETTCISATRLAGAASPGFAVVKAFLLRDAYFFLPEIVKRP